MPVKVATKKEPKANKRAEAAPEQSLTKSDVTPLTQNTEGLPEGWKSVKLGEYVVSVKGKKPKRVSLVKTKECSMPYINIKAFEKNIIDEFTDGVGCALCEDGDFLMVWDGSRSGYVGKAIKGAIGSTLVKLNFPGIDNDYAYYFLQSKFVEINTRAKGVGIPHVDPNILWNYDLLIPSLSEQHAIVSKIEELLSELDKGKQQLETAQQQLKIYKQAVLKWAFEGKLTSKNIKEGELPEGWEMTSIINLVEKNKHSLKAGPFGSSLKKEFYVREGFKIYGQEQVIADDPFLGDYFINEDKYEELKSCKVKPFDILISLVGTVGKVLILPENSHAGIINPRLIKITLDRNIYLPKFFKYYFESAVVKIFYSGAAKGTTMDVLNLGIIKTIPFPLPPLDQQQYIIQEIESRLSVCDKVEETITTSLAQAETLRQSILKKAFEGKLITKKVAPVYKPKNVYFHQMQLLGYLNFYSNQKGVYHGEMTTAKFAYLMDKIYDVPTYYDYKRWHLGPYPPEMKEAIKNKDFFGSKNKRIEVVNTEKLFQYTNPLKKEIERSVNDLVEIFSHYPEKERAHKIELMATVCKVVEDIGTTDLKLVRESMKEWKIKLDTTNFKDKAEKFNEKETKKCLEFIVEKNWNKKLLS